MKIADNILNLLNKANAYKRIFLKDKQLTQDGRYVMEDLAKFCRANVSTTIVSPVSRVVDPIASAQAEGRREVYLRLKWHLNIDDADFMKIEETEND